jgi:hypothetical protein
VRFGSRARCARDRWALEALTSAGVGLLLFSVVVSVIARAEIVFFSTVLAAWLHFPMLVGIRNTLEAGCAFMLISLGVVMVVGLAQNGPATCSLRSSPTGLQPLHGSLL